MMIAHISPCIGIVTKYICSFFALGKSRTIKVLNRLTVVASDPSHFRPTAEYKAYDLVAVYPKTEKLFHAACMTFDVDIICVAVTEKQPFFFKRSPVNGPLELRGPYDIGNLYPYITFYST
ncbi:ribonuclease P protein subunit p30-like isoform X2 [Salvelinus fontinalis]|uniref:ribonuclease P protein subunit p30-like isoform X2 n=1 Tax=Salvelinus fontinalis TaxID=8038 RepID=UPI0024861412|nr:ribonuclease P protein subunit p30-like isoform X2 [Salvelinus fontinalis]